MAEKHDFEEVWAAYDVDGDGTVSAAECFDTLSRVAPAVKKENVEALVAMITGGKGKRMTKDNLKTLLALSEKINQTPALEQLITGDKDLSGKVDKSELAAALGMKEADAAEIIAGVDEDNDGKLSITEILLAFD